MMNVTNGSAAPDEPPIAGVVHGYAIRTRIACRFLRDGGSDTTLWVEEGPPLEEPPPHPLLEWRPRPDRNFRATLSHEEGRYVFWTDTEGAFTVDPHRPSITVSEGFEPVRREERMWGVPSVVAYLSRGDLPLHAAAVEVHGKALLFPGPSRHGKTTMASGFLRAGHRMLGEDLTCCRPGEPGVVLPGPAVLRVRPDVYQRLDFPGTHPVSEDAERVHLALDADRRGTGDPVPLAGIVFLRRDSEVPAITRRTPDSAIPDLWALSLNLPSDEDRARCFRGLSSLAVGVPIWDLQRGSTIEDVAEVVDLVVNTCL